MQCNLLSNRRPGLQETTGAVLKKKARYQPLQKETRRYQPELQTTTFFAVLSVGWFQTFTWKIGVSLFPSLKNLVLSGTSQSIFTFQKLNAIFFFNGTWKRRKKNEVYRSPLEIQTQSTFGVICRFMNLKVCVKYVHVCVCYIFLLKKYIHVYIYIYTEISNSFFAKCLR